MSVAKLLMFKEKLRTLLKQHEKIVEPIGKFLLAFVIMFIINTRVAFFPVVNSIFVTLGISTVCAFINISFIMVFAGVVLILNVFKVSIEMALIVTVLFIIMFLFYFRFTKKEIVVLLFIPIAFVLKIQFCIPIVIGLMGMVISVVPVSFGVLLCYLADFVATNATALSKTNTLSIGEKFQFISQRLFANPEMIITLIACIATVVVVYVVRRKSINYAWLIAVLLGTLTSTIIMLCGYFVVNKTDGILILVIGELISFVIGIVVQFFYFSVDYSRVERLQFEDDEYYYYVKAVPKMTVAAPEVTITRYTKTEPVSEDVTPEEIVSEGLSELGDEDFLNEFENEFINDFAEDNQQD